MSASQKVRSVPCPRCTAEAGQPCHTLAVTAGWPRERSNHPERIRAFESGESPVRTPDVVPLSKAQRRHLAEMQQVANDGGEAYWWPKGSEFRTAETLDALGYLKREFFVGAGGRCFSLTALGAALALGEENEAS